MGSIGNGKHFFKSQMIRNGKYMWLESQLMTLGMRNDTLELSSAIGSLRAFFSIVETLDFTLSEMEASLKLEADGGGVSICLGT